MKHLVILLAVFLASACVASRSRPLGGGSVVVIYTAAEIVTMARPGDVARAVAVSDGEIVGVGALASLARQFPGARVDDTFARHVITPGLVDPHMHVVLSSVLYAQPFAPPWPMASPDGMTQEYPTPESFLARLEEVVEAAPPDGSPVVVYGYHNLVQGDIDRTVLDGVTTERPLVVWHYSGHDFYLNSRALALIGAEPELARDYHGVGLAPDGTLSGRLYEDAGFYVLSRLGAHLLSPAAIARGSSRYFQILRRAGVTTTADLAYGIFGLELENAAIAQTWTMEREGFRLYLVPEYRSFERAFGGGAAAAQAIREMAEGRRSAAAPVLPRVKFFADGSYYSQTMRLSPPGYQAGQSRGTEGLWVMAPDQSAQTMHPYVEAGLSVHIHSNGDAAQNATLDALATLRNEGFEGNFVIEHGGLFSPAQRRRAADLDAMVSAASHYVYYMAHANRAPLGEAREHWITPVGSLSRAGVVVALHSDAPLAPPQPLRAAGAQIARSTREGVAYELDEALSRYDALEAITLDAARVLGLDAEIGSIEVGKRADFTILSRNPLRTRGERWVDIQIRGVILDGRVRAWP